MHMHDTVEPCLTDTPEKQIADINDDVDMHFAWSEPLKCGHCTSLFHMAKGYSYSTTSALELLISALL